MQTHSTALVFYISIIILFFPIIQILTKDVESILKRSTLCYIFQQDLAPSGFLANTKKEKEKGDIQILPKF